MNIIDTNGISHVFDNNIILQDNYYISPDVAEEIEVAQLVHGRKLSNKVTQISSSSLFDESIYINHYKEILNIYGGRSFYNMTGFGDVSIIATLHMLMDVFDQQNNTQLFDTTEKVIVYTNDRGLTNKIQKIFINRDIDVKSVAKIT